MAEEFIPQDPASVKIPTSQELYDFFSSFLLKWLKVPAQRVEGIDDDIQVLPNEQGLLFIQPTSGVLVIRTSEDFGKALAKLGQNKGVTHDLFVEMIVLVWHRFVSHFWQLDSRTLPPALFKKSFPKDWPDRKPDSHLVVLVLQQPVEICLWFYLTGEDMKRWKNPLK